MSAGTYATGALGLDLRPVAPAGRCARCGGATWQHQAQDVCGQCGRMTQHEAPELRLRMGVAR